MAAAADTVKFPSKEAITAYLNKHHLTNNSYNIEKKINDTVATFFANERKVPQGIKMGVMLSLYDLNEKLRLPAVALIPIQMNLVAALMDYANQIPLS